MPDEEEVRVGEMSKNQRRMKRRCDWLEKTGKKNVNLVVVLTIAAATATCDSSL